MGHPLGFGSPDLPVGAASSPLGSPGLLPRPGRPTVVSDRVEGPDLEPMRMGIWTSRRLQLTNTEQEGSTPWSPAKPVGTGQGGNRIAGPASHFPGVGLVRWPVTEKLNWGKTEIMLKLER